MQWHIQMFVRWSNMTNCPVLKKEEKIPILNLWYFFRQRSSFKFVIFPCHSSIFFRKFRENVWRASPRMFIYYNKWMQQEDWSIIAWSYCRQRPVLLDLPSEKHKSSLLHVHSIISQRMHRAKRVEKASIQIPMQIVYQIGSGEAPVQRKVYCVGDVYWVEKQSFDYSK